MSWLKRRGRGVWQELAPLAGVTGKCAIRRDGDTVTFLTNGLKVDAAGIVNLADIDPGYRPVANATGINGREGYLVSTLGEIVTVSVFAGALRILRAVAGRTYEGTVTWQTGDPQP